MTENASRKEWNSADDLAGWLDLDGGAKSVYWMVYKGTAPRHYKIAGKLKFRRCDIEEWIEQQAVEPRAKAS